MDLQISLVKKDERYILENILGYYLYDLNEVFLEEHILFEFQNDGKLHYPNLDLYWQEDSRFAYLFRVGDNLVGCGLVHQNPFFNKDKQVHVISEFYVAKMYRRHGIGIQAAIKMMHLHLGGWELRIAKQNARAYKFWSTVMNKAAKNNSFKIHEKYDSEWNGYVMCADVY